MFPAVSDCPTEPAISRKVPLSLGSPRKVRSIPKAFVIVPLDFTSCNKSAYQPFILSRGYLFRYLRRSEEHTSELQSLMRISYAVCLSTEKNRHIIHAILSAFLYEQIVTYMLL